MTLRELIVQGLVGPGRLPDSLALAVALRREFNHLISVGGHFDEHTSQAIRLASDTLDAALPEASRNLPGVLENAEAEALNLHLVAALYWFLTGELPASEDDIESAGQRAATFSENCS